MDGMIAARIPCTPTDLLTGIVLAIVIGSLALLYLIWLENEL